MNFAHKPQTGGSNGPLFTTLPAELRRMVLTHAFGGRVIHVIDVNTEHPRTKQGRPASFVCLERCSVHSNLDRSVNPGADQCMHVLKDDRHLQYSLGLGVMGWLLACRRAHTEGIEILYTTNTFHHQGGHLPSALCRIFSFRHWSSIRSLEWVIDFHYLRDERERCSELNRRPEKLFDSVARALPGLRRLYIGFTKNMPTLGPPWLQNPKQYHVLYDGRLLPAVDGLVRDFGSQLEELEVGLPLTMFDSQHQSLKEKYGEAARFQFAKYNPCRFPSNPLGSVYPRPRVWRVVLPFDGAVVDRTTRIPTGGGYWISQSGHDLPWVGMGLLPRDWWKSDEIEKQEFHTSMGCFGSG